jgi:hypothetical protein
MFGRSFIRGVFNFAAFMSKKLVPFPTAGIKDEPYLTNLLLSLAFYPTTVFSPAGELTYNSDNLGST